MLNGLPDELRDGLNDAAADPRADLLYVEEQRSLKFGEALSLLIKSWRFIRPHRTMVALKFLIALASLPVFLLIPWPLKIIIDNVIDGRPLEGMVRRLLLPLAGNDRLLLLAVVVGLLLLGMLLAGTIGDRSASLDAHVSSGGLDQPGITSNQANNGWSLVGGLFGLLEVWITLVLTQRLNQTVRTTVYERFLQAPLRLFADQKIGDAVFRVMYDSAAIGEVLYSGVLSPVLSITMIALTTAVLWEHFRNEPLIPILAAVALPVVTMASFFFGPWLRNQSQRMREQGSAVMAAFEERLAQVHLVRAFGQEERETAAIDVESRSSFTATLKMIVLVMLLLLCVIPVLGLLAAIGVYHLMSEVIANRITLGDVTLLAMYGMMLARPMVALGMVWTWLQAPIAGMRRIHSVLEDLPCESGSPENHYFAGHIQKIQFNDVTVGYGPHSVAVDHLNLCFVSGELAGIAGPSGAGKSTLVNCLPGFLEPSSGEITVNGIDISTISRQTLRKRISLVFQDEALFSATIAENIRYGSPDVSSSAVRRAAEMADAAGFIERLPQGYSTMLGRRGTRLSVGQKQRVAIARALLVESDAVVLDEPTGPLDPAAESRLMITLQQLAKTRLVIVVAHREATLALCDKVYFMTDGHVRASGTHAELIKNCPAYQAYVAVGEPANTNHRVPQL